MESKWFDCLRMCDSEACSHTRSCPALEEPKASHSPVLFMVTVEIGEEAIERVWMFANESSS